MYFSDQSNFNRAEEEFEQRNKSALQKRRITRRKKSEESRVKEKEQGRGRVEEAVKRKKKNDRNCQQFFRRIICKIA